MIDVAIHDDQFTDTVNRYTSPHHHRYIASTTKTTRFRGSIASLFSRQTLTRPSSKSKLNLDSSENTSLLQLSSAFHSLIRVHQRTLFRRFSTPIKGFLLAILLCIFILFRRRFAVLGHVSTPMFSFHRAFFNRWTKNDDPVQDVGEHYHLLLLSSFVDQISSSSCHYQFPGTFSRLGKLFADRYSSAELSVQASFLSASV